MLDFLSIIYTEIDNPIEGRNKENAYLTSEVADPISSGILCIELKETSKDLSK